MAGTTPIFGFPYPESSDLVADYPALGQDLAEDVESVLSAGFGKVLQVVRATDTTRRTTTSTSYIDANLSVTITPQRSTSAIILIASYFINSPSATHQLFLRITDSSNNNISGAERTTYYSGAGDMQTQATFIGYATPASVSAVTYKIRFAVTSGTGTLYNDLNTAQLFAIEVSA